MRNKLFKSLAFLAIVPFMYAQSAMDPIVLQFSDPAKAGHLSASLIQGGIDVRGHDSQDIVIKLVNGTPDEASEPSSGKANGLTLIRSNATELSVEEEDNHVRVKFPSWKHAGDLTILVPRQTSLSLHCVNHGDIYVSGVEGKLDINNVNGRVNLEGISGAVVAHAFNFGMKVQMDRVFPDEPMSFTSFNGDLDITLPADSRATLKLDTQGDIYSGFDIPLQNRVNRNNDQTRDADGKLQIKISQFLEGKLNGGGAEVTFKTVRGDIYLRKGE